MGSGIAQVCAQAGYATVVREVSDELVDKGLGRIRDFLGKSVGRGKATHDEVRGVLERLSGTTALVDLADCDLVIEAVTEDIEVKRQTYAALDEACKESTIFASNTSSLSITEMAVLTKRPDRFIGLHFFSPVPLMKLVEVIYTLLTDQAVVEAGHAFGESIGKTPVLAKDRTGFIVNRLLVPYMLEAIRVLDEGLASVEDIDNAMKLGCGYPMGPFALLDFVGLDTTFYIANIMFDEFRTPQFAPPPLLKRMVLAGHHGRKSRRGFYDYSE
jgi:3-hydroxybutyryl-CoA dehydrogenase